MDITGFRWKCIVAAHLASIATLLVGCMNSGQDGQPAVWVKVSSDGEQCRVMERTASCDNVADLLIRQLSIPFSRRIAVAASGAGEVSMTQSRKIETLIKAAGYPKVAAVGFLSEPGNP